MPYLGNPHLGWTISEPDTGVYNAMNKGAAHARGDYLLFLNAGDTLLSGILGRVFKESLDADIAYGDILASRNGHDTLWTSPEASAVVPALFLFRSLPHPGSFISRNAFVESGGYDEAFRIVSDAAFFLRLAGSGKARFRHLPFTIARVRFGGLSTDTRQDEAHRREREAMLAPVFGATVAHLAAFPSERRPWIRASLAASARRDPALAAALLRTADLCAALWRTRPGRTLLRGFTRLVERRESIIQNRCS